MNKKSIKSFIFENKVVILFVLLCIGGFIASNQSLTFVMGELVTRIGRNSFLVLSLIIPVLAGMGMNFGIVIGAMAAQIAIFLTTYWGFVGISGFLLTALLATPMAIIFGFLVGKLFNKIKGSEMIGGLVLGYFADGFYQLLFLFIFGGIIKINSTTLMVPTGIGVKNTIDLKDTVKYALDAVPMLTIVEFGFYAIIVLTVISTILKLAQKQVVNYKKTGMILVGAAVIYALTFVPFIEAFLSRDELVLLTAIEIGCACVAVWNIVRLAAQKFILKKRIQC